MGFMDLFKAKKPKEAPSMDIESPVKGKVVALKDVPDEAFASGMLGQGLGVVPSENVVVAPCDCKVTSVFPTLHAIGLALPNGAELLVHVGINTVELNGEHFQKFVSDEQSVKKGDKLVSFDKAAIEAAGYNTTVIILVTNSDEFASVTGATVGEAGNGEKVIRLAK